MNIKSVLLFFILFIFNLQAFTTQKVYILHGYAGTAIQMDKIYKGLKNEGYIVDNYTYDGFTKCIDTISHDLFIKVKNENYDTVSFVTHSMGGLIVRSMYQYLEPTNHFPFIYRFIMLAPPNKGTEIADFFSSSTLSVFLGPNVDLMRTDSNSYAFNLPVPTCEVGLIVGIKGKRPWFNPFMKDDNDGTVTMKSAVLGNEKEIVTVKSMHILMPLKKKVITYIIKFMKTGSFGKTGISNK